MPNLQEYFSEFHDNIKLGNFDEDQTLREKRDLLVQDLRAGLPDDAPSFTNFDQGSYAMFTGTNPKDGNYDIDVGIIFDCTKDDYEDPVELKKIVRDALTRGNRNVAIRRPCITVEYLKNSEVDYHVDLAIYVNRGYDNYLDLAKGKEFSESENRFWEISDPKGLISMINNKFSDSDEMAQMRRCIRYFKRWRDYKLISGKPFSIALTVAAFHWFSPYKDNFSDKYQDVDALISLCDMMLANFDTNTWLAINLPVQPYGDLNGRMTVHQMDTFNERLEAFRDALKRASDEDVKEEACKILRKQFGNEFPVPEKKDTAKTAAVAGFAPAGASA
jgi:predicted nucleotidyltransferase